MDAYLLRLKRRSIRCAVLCTSRVYVSMQLIHASTTLASRAPCRLLARGLVANLVGAILSMLALAAESVLHAVNN